jgi:cytochrome P450
MYGPEFADDLAEFYARTRAARGPVTPVLLVGDVPAWLVMSYRDVLHVCRNPQIFSRSSYHWNLWDQIPADWPLMYPVAPIPAVLHAEGEEHRRRAGAISDVMEETDHLELARLCERTADQLIDSFTADGEADLIAQYTQQLVPTVLARLLGFPEEQIPGLNAETILGSTSHPDAAAACLHAIGRLGAFVAEQREKPGSGLAARLLRHPARLTDEELTLDLFIFLGAGQQPTANWIGSTLRLMLTDEEFSRDLQGGRSSVDQALNEVLWQDPPIHNLVGRWALHDVELGGHLIRKGDFICVSLAAANADARGVPAAEVGARTGSGTTLGVNRAHVAFAQGEHSCPAGVPDLAGIIAKTAVEVLLDRLPDTHLAVPAGTLRWNESTWLRSLESLPVAFTPIAPVPG